MKLFKWFKKQVTPRTGYVKRATCGHYVLADSRTTTYLEVRQSIVHTENGAKIDRGAVPITLCDKCAQDVK